MRERCPRDGKALNSSGECAHCGKSYPAMVGTPMTRGEVKEAVRRVRALRSGSCLGRRHGECRVPTCECICHRRAAALRREANQLEHDGVEPDAVERAEELRSRADDWYGGDS